MRCPGFDMQWLAMLKCVNKYIIYLVAGDLLSRCFGYLFEVAKNYFPIN